MTALITNVTESGVIYFKTENLSHDIKINAVYKYGVLTYSVYIMLHNDTEYFVIDIPVITSKIVGSLEYCIQTLTDHVDRSSVQRKGDKFSITWNRVVDAVVYDPELDFEDYMDPNQKFKIKINYYNFKRTIDLSGVVIENDNCYLVYNTNRNTVKRVKLIPIENTNLFYKGLNKVNA